jgi:hypothetical protein
VHSGSSARTTVLLMRKVTVHVVGWPLPLYSPAST